MSEQRFLLAFQFLKDESAAAARLLEQQDTTDAAAFLSKAPANSVTRVLQNMVPDVAAQILAAADLESTITWMLALDTPNLCALLRYLEDENIERLLAQLPLKKQAACQLLLSYRADMVGAWAETDIPVATDQMHVGEVIKRLQRRRYRDRRLIIILDGERHPIGVVQPADLFQANDDLPILQLMQASREQLRGRVTLSTAIQQECWRKQDYVLIVNRHRQWVGLLWHCQLRQQIEQAIAHPSLNLKHQYAVNEILQAHGDSMKALLLAFRDGFRA